MHVHPQRRIGFSLVLLGALSANNLFGLLVI
jgi:hypothetical protein